MANTKYRYNFSDRGKEKVYQSETPHSASTHVLSQYKPSKEDSPSAGHKDYSYNKKTGNVTFSHDREEDGVKVSGYKTVPTTKEHEEELKNASKEVELKKGEFRPQTVIRRDVKDKGSKTIFQTEDLSPRAGISTVMSPDDKTKGTSKVKHYSYNPKKQEISVGSYKYGTGESKVKRISADVGHEKQLKNASVDFSCDDIMNKTKASKMSRAFQHYSAAEDKKTAKEESEVHRVSRPSMLSGEIKNVSDKIIRVRPRQSETMSLSKAKIKDRTVGKEGPFPEYHVREKETPKKTQVIVQEPKYKEQSIFTNKKRSTGINMSDVKNDKRYKLQSDDTIREEGPIGSRTKVIDPYKENAARKSISDTCDDILSKYMGTGKYSGSGANDPVVTKREGYTVRERPLPGQTKESIKAGHIKAQKENVPKKLESHEKEKSKIRDEGYKLGQKNPASQYAPPSPPEKKYSGGWRDYFRRSEGNMDLKKSIDDLLVKCNSHVITGETEEGLKKKKKQAPKADGHTLGKNPSAKAEDLEMVKVDVEGAFKSISDTCDNIMKGKFADPSGKPKEGMALANTKMSELGQRKIYPKHVYGTEEEEKYHPNKVRDINDAAKNLKQSEYRTKKRRGGKYDENEFSGKVFRNSTPSEVHKEDLKTDKAIDSSIKRHESKHKSSESDLMKSVNDLIEKAQLPGLNKPAVKQTRKVKTVEDVIRTEKPKNLIRSMVDELMQKSLRDVVNHGTNIRRGQGYKNDPDAGIDRKKEERMDADEARGGRKLLSFNDYHDLDYQKKTEKSMDDLTTEKYIAKSVHLFKDLVKSEEKPIEFFHIPDETYKSQKTILGKWKTGNVLSIGGNRILNTAKDMASEGYTSLKKEDEDISREEVAGRKKMDREDARAENKASRKEYSEDDGAE